VATCVYHVQAGEPLAIQPIRHYCEEHYFAWRDGPRTGPALVESGKCGRACETCKLEAAATTAPGKAK
jgi:hypothetical protein